VLNVHFVILGACLQVIGEGFYSVDTIRGRTQPNRVSWLIWGIAPLSAFAVEVQAGVGLRSLMTFVSGAGPLVILGVSFLSRRSVWKLSRLDLLCGVISGLGLIGWAVTRQGLVALVASIGAVTLASFPTFIKSWKYPESETWVVYMGGLISAVLTLLTVDKVTADVVAFPLDSAAITFVLVLLVGRRAISKPRLRRVTRLSPVVDVCSGLEQTGPDRAFP
jgi:hypothetical protein